MQLRAEIEVINEGVFQHPIIPNGYGWRSYEYNLNSIIESGEKRVLMDRIIFMINSAREFICLQSFLVQKSPVIDALVEAQARGVRVFILSSVEARLKDTIEEERDFIKEDYIKLLNETFRNRFVHRSAENFHAKYILIDPKTNPKGFLCTNNFTLNGFTKNPELAVELSPNQCEELFKIFTYHFWEHSSFEQTATNEFEHVKPAGVFRLESLEHVLLTSPNSSLSNLEQQLIKAVNSAQNRIVLTTYGLDKSNALIVALKEKARQSIEVSVFVRDSEKLFQDHITDLLDSGIKIFLHPFTHAKSLLIDSTEGYIFTANISENGMTKGFEVGVKLDKVQTDLLNETIERWREDYPFRAQKSAIIKDLNEVGVYRDGKLVKRAIIEDKKEISKKITKVNDLVHAFLQKPVINDKYTKSLKTKVVAELPELPEQYRQGLNFGGEKFLVQNIEERKGVISKVIAVSKSFTNEDISLIEKHNDLKIYFVKT